MTSAEPLLIVGSIAFDDLEIPSGKHRDVLGGSATYAAISARLLSRGDVRVVGVVGTDFPESIISDLRKHGIDTSGIERAEGRTFRWYGRYSNDLASRTTLDTQLNVFADFSPKIPLSHRESPFLMLGNIHPTLQLDVVDQVRPTKFVAADTMNFWIEQEREQLALVLRRIDLLIVNDEEARQLSGIHNLVRAASDIRKRGPKSLVIKRGEFGALLFDDTGTFFVPAYPLEEVLDPTGAGDAFAGGLMGYAASQGSANPLVLRRGMFFAAALGSFCVEGVGPERLLRAGRADVSARMKSFEQLVDFGGGLIAPE
jgi:sugar/nucleoside kinase (ribokinase family)